LSVSWFLVSVPVVSEHRISTPAISSMAESLETIAFCLESASIPECYGDREHRGHRHRDRGHQLHQHELQDGERILQAPVVDEHDLVIIVKKGCCHWSGKSRRCW